jgi:CBS-domain-containing membrane protein
MSAGADDTTDAVGVARDDLMSDARAYVNGKYVRVLPDVAMVAALIKRVGAAELERDAIRAYRDHMGLTAQAERIVKAEAYIKKLEAKLAAVTSERDELLARLK